MMERQSAREQAKRGLRVGSVIAIVTAGVLAAVYLVTRYFDVPFSDLTRDAAATLEGPWYTGALSNLSVALSFVGAGIALFAASLLPDGEGPSRKGLLVSLGITVIVVAADDLLMLHEAVFPELGLSALVVFVIYAVALLTILVIWRSVILGQTDYVFLLLAAAALAASVIVDVVFIEERIVELPFAGELIEDPAKILGMVFMAYYLIVTARQALLTQPESNTN